MLKNLHMLLYLAAKMSILFWGHTFFMQTFWIAIWY